VVPSSTEVVVKRGLPFLSTIVVALNTKALYSGGLPRFSEIFLCGSLRVTIPTLLNAFQTSILTV
jgi:hypothetical protein